MDSMANDQKSAGTQALDETVFACGGGWASGLKTKIMKAPFYLLTGVRGGC